MIFLTVGTQLPFDRLARSVDQWAAARGRSDIFGQIADPGPGPESYRPQHFEWTAFIGPDEFQRRFETADCVVAHAGMGTIISALSLGKPVLIMPRRAALREQRNDHQIATAKRFGDKHGVFVASEEAEMPAALDALVEAAGALKMSPMSTEAADKLAAALREKILSL